MDDVTPTNETVAIPVVIGIAAIGPCILWAGNRDRDGYAKRTVGGRNALAHRVAWAEVHGDPCHWQVLHRCDVRACVNVDHLFLGTNADNVADMVAKGRQTRNHGEQNGSAKLTVDQVREIRLSTGVLRVVASQYGVSETTVSMIRRRKKWAFLL